MTALVVDHDQPALGEDATALFSPDRTYRYALTRRWDDRPMAAFIMLNPSTADAFVLDPTVRLAEALHAARAAVVVSGYGSDLYDRELYPGWDRHTMAAFTGNSSGDRTRTEVLWSNRPIGVQRSLFDTQGGAA